MLFILKAVFVLGILFSMKHTLDALTFSRKRLLYLERFPLRIPAKEVAKIMAKDIELKEICLTEEELNISIFFMCLRSRIFFAFEFFVVIMVSLSLGPVISFFLIAGYALLSVFASDESQCLDKDKATAEAVLGLWAFSTSIIGLYFLWGR